MTLASASGRGPSRGQDRAAPQARRSHRDSRRTRSADADAVALLASRCHGTYDGMHSSSRMLARPASLCIAFSADAVSDAIWSSQAFRSGHASKERRISERTSDATCSAIHEDPTTPSSLNTDDRAARPCTMDEGYDDLRRSANSCRAAMLVRGKGIFGIHVSVSLSVDGLWISAPASSSQLRLGHVDGSSEEDTVTYTESVDRSGIKRNENGCRQRRRCHRFRPQF